MAGTARTPAEDAETAESAEVAGSADSPKRADSLKQVAREPTPRPLTDPREIRAIAHPVRLSLLEALTREGPLTATQAAEIVDESPANCSFHLRTLAKYGFVEEVPGSTGRARPWRRVALGQSFSEDQVEPAAAIAAHALSGLAHERVFERIRLFQDNLDGFPPEWRAAGFSGDVLVYLRADELTELGEEIMQLLMRYSDRTMDLDKRPSDARPVQLAAFGSPLRQNPSGN